MSRTTLLHNSVSLILGRILLSVGRLGAAVLVTRLAGMESFGSYALLLSMIALFEWLVDFGQTDIVVRDITQHPDRAHADLAALGRAKAVMAVLGAVALPAGLWLAHYPSALVLAGGVGAVSVVFTAGLQPARVRARLAMRMDLDIGAELIGLIVMLPVLALAARAGLGLPALVATFALSRAVQWAVLSWWSRTLGPSVGAGASLSDAQRLFRAAAPLGAAGLLVVLYDALAPLILSKLLDMHSVALYAAAARFIFPVIIVVQAINNAFFVVLSGAWSRDRTRFEEAQQTALVLSVCVAGMMFTGIHGASDFLMGLLGRDFAAAADVLRLLAWVLLLRAVTTAMSPLIVIAGYQGKALWLTIASLVTQTVALLVLVPRLGVAGAAISYLAVELTLGTVAVSVIGQRVTGVRLDWGQTAAMLGLAALVAIGVGASPLHGLFVAGIVGPLAFALACLATGTVSIARLHRMWRALNHSPAMETGT